MTSTLDLIHKWAAQPLSETMKWSLRKSYIEWRENGRADDAEKLADEAMREYQYDVRAAVEEETKATH